MVRNILRFEGLVVFITAIYLYYIFSFSPNWLMFILLLFVPDISMIGYLKNKKLGAIIYNLGHTYILSLGVTFAGLIMQYPMVFSWGLILMAHIGMDRFFGFGLKYPSNFKDTHIQKL